MVAVEVCIWCRWEEVVGLKAHHRADAGRSNCEIYNHAGIVCPDHKT
jgi:hypothetical protein